MENKCLGHWAKTLQCQKEKAVQSIQSKTEFINSYTAPAVWVGLGCAVRDGIYAASRAGVWEKPAVEAHIAYSPIVFYTPSLV